MKQFLSKHLNTVVTVLTLVTLIFSYGVTSADSKRDLQEFEDSIEAVHAQVLRNSIWDVYNNGDLDEVPTEVLFYGAEVCDEYIGAGYNHRTKEKCACIYTELESR